MDRPANTRLAVNLHARVVDSKLSRNRHIFSRADKLWTKRPRGRQRAHVYEVRVSVAKEKVYAGRPRSADRGDEAPVRVSEA
ncbi:hypothetical protein DVH05_008522 [Phytophthora capsici]|nr:hypothetical protein DVH05_008522 [Phytophthora capsici]